MGGADEVVARRHALERELAALLHTREKPSTHPTCRPAHLGLHGGDHARIRRHEIEPQARTGPPATPRAPHNASTHREAGHRKVHVALLRAVKFPSARYSTHLRACVSACASVRMRVARLAHG